MQAMTDTDIWISFAERLVRLGYELAATAQLKGDDGNDHIRLITVTLIARTLSNARGSLSMLKDKRVVEARILTRCCFENQFWAVGFTQEPEECRKAMVDGEMKNRGSRGEMMFKFLDGMSAEVETTLRTWLRKNKGWSKARTTSPKQVAMTSQVGQSYIFYDNLSADAAHPTISALDRYMVSPDGKFIKEILLDPEADEDELASTGNWLCLAVLGTLMAASDILASSMQTQITAIAEEYVGLMKSPVRPDQTL